MFPNSNPESLCKEISGELRDISTWLSGGELTPEQFRTAVTTLEAKKLSRFGFCLYSDISENGEVHFSLRHADTDELCASIDVDPLTGKMAIQRACC